MKKLLIALGVACLLYSCTDKKAEEKKAMDGVMDVHEKVMNADEHLMNNKAQLDTLAKRNNFAGKDTAATLSKRLDSAEQSMQNWMHTFNPDNTGKTHDEVMAYLGNQKKQIIAVDSTMKAAIEQSDKYLSTLKKK